MFRGALRTLHPVRGKNNRVSACRAAGIWMDLYYKMVERERRGNHS